VNIEPTGKESVHEPDYGSRGNSRRVRVQVMSVRRDGTRAEFDKLTSTSSWPPEQHH
jgi:hypothetical protein